MAKKQISDLNVATLDDLNDNCQFIIDDSNRKTKKVSFNVLKQKIGSGGEVSGLFMGAPDWNNVITLFNNRVSPVISLFDPTSLSYRVGSNGTLRIYNILNKGLAPIFMTLAINGNAAYANLQQLDGSDCDQNTFIPVAEGDILNLLVASGGIEIYFIPNKKIQIDMSDVVTPQIVMPDYKATPITANNGWTATENGWLRIAYGGNLSGTASAYVQIDGVTVSRATHVSNTTNTNTDGMIVPIGKNSVVTIVANSGFVVQCDFYPCKAV